MWSWGIPSLSNHSLRSRMENEDCASSCQWNTFSFSLVTNLKSTWFIIIIKYIFYDLFTERFGETKMVLFYGMTVKTPIWKRYYWVLSIIAYLMDVTQINNNSKSNNNRSVREQTISFHIGSIYTIPLWCNSCPRAFKLRTHLDVCTIRHVYDLLWSRLSEVWKLKVAE